MRCRRVVASAASPPCASVVARPRRWPSSWSEPYPMATILVIGASRGIGLEFVRQYREAGDRVIATARDEAGLARLRALDATALRVDVADPASISGLSWQLDGERIDTALYVAG